MHYYHYSYYYHKNNKNISNDKQTKIKNKKQTHISLLNILSDCQWNVSQIAHYFWLRFHRQTSAIQVRIHQDGPKQWLLWQWYGIGPCSIYIYIYFSKILSNIGCGMSSLEKEENTIEFVLFFFLFHFICAFNTLTSKQSGILLFLPLLKLIFR